MTIFQAIILGIFQGITEFLPISSSGHLVILQHLFKIEEGNLFFTEMLHFGTLLSIFIVFFSDIIKMIVEFFKMLGKGIANRKFKITNIYQKLALMIIVGSIPTALIGFAFKDFFEGLYASLLSIGIAFLLTGIFLWLSEKISHNNKQIKDITVQDALIVGTFQGIAITPGISRSGSTIVGGLLRGFDKKFATEFSFLLALPATFGAAIFGVRDALKVESEAIFDLPLLIGMIVSTVVGIISIKILMSTLQKGKLHYFSYYLWTIGIIIILLQLFG